MALLVRAVERLRVEDALERDGERAAQHRAAPPPLKDVEAARVELAEGIPEFVRNNYNRTWSNMDYYSATQGSVQK